MLPSSDEARLPRQGLGDAGRCLLEQVVAQENMQRAWKRVKANKGGAGVDRLDIVQTEAHLRQVWMTLPLFRVALNPRFTRPFYAVPRTSAARTASG